jgi:flagellar FliL protein
MADAILSDDGNVSKRSNVPLFLGLILAVVGGCGGFLAVQKGMIHGLAPSHSEAQTVERHLLPENVPDIAFLPMAPMVISIGEGNLRSHVRFVAQLEVPITYKKEVEFLLPRIVNVLNSYLRALKLSDFEEPAALPKLRGHMMRRINLVVGEGRVNDILVMEFVVN